MTEEKETIMFSSPTDASAAPLDYTPKLFMTRGGKPIAPYVASDHPDLRYVSISGIIGNSVRASTVEISRYLQAISVSDSSNLVRNLAHDGALYTFFLAREVLAESKPRFSFDRPDEIADKLSSSYEFHKNVLIYNALEIFSRPEFVMDNRIDQLPSWVASIVLSGRLYCANDRSSLLFSKIAKTIDLIVEKSKHYGKSVPEDYYLRTL